MATLEQLQQTLLLGDQSTWSTAEIPAPARTAYEQRQYDNPFGGQDEARALLYQMLYVERAAKAGRKVPIDYEAARQGWPGIGKYDQTPEGVPHYDKFDRPNSTAEKGHQLRTTAELFGGVREDAQGVLQWENSKGWLADILGVFSSKEDQAKEEAFLRGVKEAFAFERYRKQRNAEWFSEFRLNEQRRAGLPPTAEAFPGQERQPKTEI